MHRAFFLCVLRASAVVCWHPIAPDQPQRREKRGEGILSIQKILLELLHSHRSTAKNLAKVSRPFAGLCLCEESEKKGDNVLAEPWFIDYGGVVHA